MFKLELGLARMEERWHVVLGRDDLMHWLCVAVDHTEIVDADETTWCGQSFWSFQGLPEQPHVSCIECAARKDAS